MNPFLFFLFFADGEKVFAMAPRASGLGTLDIVCSVGIMVFSCV